MSYHRCAKCNSDQMMDGAYVADANGPRVVVGLDRHPDRGPLPQSVSTQIHACVCGSCGFIELYANQPAEMHEIYQRVAKTRSVEV
jgi:predicted nucleic-acid-binding Zn-ribbon protein